MAKLNNFIRDNLTNFLCLIIITMLSGYFVRESQLRKEQTEINQELREAIKDLRKSISDQSIINYNLNQSNKMILEWKNGVDKEIIELYKINLSK